MTNITIQNIIEAREVLIVQRIELKKELDYLDSLLNLSEQLLNDELYNPEPLSFYVVILRSHTTRNDDSYTRKLTKLTAEG